MFPIELGLGIKPQTSFGIESVALDNNHCLAVVFLECFVPSLPMMDSVEKDYVYLSK